MLAQLQVFYGTESVAAASHVFDYHNNLVGGSNQLFHDNTEVWQVPTHNWLQDLPALGGSKSTNHSGSLYLGAGVGIGKVGAEVGYNYSNSTVNTNTAAMLIDITGDGLPDKLFRQADGNVVS